MPRVGEVDASKVLHHEFRSMASSVRIQIVDPTSDAQARLASVEGVFRDVEATCTRFNPASALMQVNSDPKSRHVVPPLLFNALSAAHEAYVRTAGRFDPRVLDDLVRAGYDRSFEFTKPGDKVEATTQTPSWWSRSRRREWKPKFDKDSSAVSIGNRAIDLGGIGKGLAVRWAMEYLTSAGTAVLLEAGGDIATTGRGPDGHGWRVAVENPWNVEGDPAVVLDASDAAVATSSIRLRTWTVNGATQHHLIDARTGRPAQSGLQSVTVVGNDTAWAEVWSKAAFIEGKGGIRAFADEQRLAVTWIDDNGNVGISRRAQDRVVWKVSRVQQ